MRHVEFLLADELSRPEDAASYSKFIILEFAITTLYYIITQLYTVGIISCQVINGRSEMPSQRKHVKFESLLPAPVSSWLQDRRDRDKKVTGSDLWVIHGETYDLTAFVA